MPPTRHHMPCSADHPQADAKLTCYKKRAPWRVAATWRGGASLRLLRPDLERKDMFVAGEGVDQTLGALFVEPVGNRAILDYAILASQIDAEGIEAGFGE